MTLNSGVTDDQLGQYYRRTTAIADRLGKSLQFDQVMEALQGIHDGPRRGGDIVSAITEGRTELWFHEGQREDSCILGRVIYAHLQENGLLSSCADLDELKAIQAKGIEFFRRHFAGKAIFGWRGVQGGGVPYLIEYGGEVMLGWYWLDSHWSSYSPALRRK